MLSRQTKAGTTGDYSPTLLVQQRGPRRLLEYMIFFGNEIMLLYQNLELLSQVFS